MKTVNFIEAVNSGRRFRHSDVPCISYYDGVVDCIADVFDGVDNEFYLEDIINMVNAKYVLEEKEVTITESQFEKALEKHGRSYSSAKDFWAAFKKELGF